MSICQCHDGADQNDIVLRDQISKILFIVLPKISSVLVKVCQEMPLNGPHLVRIAVVALGRFLTLILQDYCKINGHGNLTNKDFIQLVAKKSSIAHSCDDENKIKILDVQKSEEWMKMASENLSTMLTKLRSLRGSEYAQIRFELAIFSFNLLNKSLPNVKLFMRFLIENLIVFADDADRNIQNYSESKLAELAMLIPNLNQEISELFSLHLDAMPRVIMMCTESEQLANMTLLNSFVRTFSNGSLQLDRILNNQILLEKFINVMICSCELEAPKELIFHETSCSNNLDDQFYQIKMPWKVFRHLKSEAVTRKLTDVCRNFGRLDSTRTCVNFIMDHVNSIEYVVFLLEILSCDTDLLNLSNEEFENILEEFLDDSNSYWNLPIKISDAPKYETRHNNEQWFEDHTLGLYESAIEVRLYDKDATVEAEEEKENNQRLNLKTIKYNILCTCIITELCGSIAMKLGKKFQRYNLRVLYRVLEKAGNTNFLIKSAGVYTLHCIKEAMGYDDLSHLIDENSNFLLFNIRKMLKFSHDKESIIDMISVVFKYSQTSVTAYVEDIVEIAANQITNRNKLNELYYHLKLFELYVNAVKNQMSDYVSDVKLEQMDINKADEESEQFVQQCINELEKNDDCENSNEQKETQSDIEEHNEIDVAEEVEQTQPEEKLPPHIDLIIKILTASLPFFATSDTRILILIHQIFESALPILHIHEKPFLPMIHQIWYPFTKQFQGKNLVVLQHSFNLLVLIAHFAKDFVYKRTTEKIVPLINEFLKSSHRLTNKNENLSYTQLFKLQRDVLSHYGKLSLDLGIDNKQLDDIINLIILYYDKHSNDKLKSASKISIDILSIEDPMLMKFKLSFK